AASERGEPDNACAHAVELGDVVFERAVLPPGVPGSERYVHVAVVPTDEKGQLEAHAAAFVTRASVLILFGRVRPALRLEQLDDPLVILQPDGDVDVVVSSRDGAHVECRGRAADR